VNAVKAAVTAAGAPEDIDVEMAGFAPPTVPVETEVSVTVSQIEFDSESGRFSGALTVTGENMSAISSRITGRVEAVAEVPVAVTRLLPETLLRADDVHVMRLRVSRLTSDVVRDVDQIVGMQLRRPVPAGQPLRADELMRPPLVQRGSLVRLEFNSGDLSLSAQGTAIDDGADGERIRVQNTNSRAFLYADVVGPGRVRVVAGLPPVQTMPVKLERARRRP
jgi:flagellar basal body P-ring formation protein FlgA